MDKYDKVSSVQEEILKTLESGNSDTILAIVRSGQFSPAQPLGTDNLTLLHYLCQHGKLVALKKIAFTHPECIIQTVLCQYSLLHCACKHGQVCIVQYLIDNGLYDETMMTMDGASSPLHLAVKSGHLGTVNYLLDHSPCYPMLVDEGGDYLIHTACQEGNFDMVKCLAKTDIYDRNIMNCHTRQTPLHVAASQGHLNIVQYLVEETKSDPVCVDNVGRTPLYLAVWNGRVKTVQYLASILKGEQLTITTREDVLDDGSSVAAGKTPLHAACLRGHYNIVCYLVEECHYSITFSDEKGNLPLHSASAGGNLNIVKYLIEECLCDPMCLQHEFQWAPLHFAASKGHLPLAKYLIEQYTCDPMCHTKTGHAPLHFAAQNGHFDSLKYLIEECKCDPMCLSKKGQAPLHLASQNGHFDTVKYLIEECQCDPMCLEDDETFQYAPLHFASSEGYLPIVKYLIEVHGCDPMCHTNTGHALIHLAAEDGHFDTVKYLIEECQCEPMTTMCDEKFQQVALHFAAINGHLAIVKYLIEVHGCDPMCHTNTGCSPLHLAAENGHFDTVKYLIEECQCEPMSTVCDERFCVVPLHFVAFNGHLSIVKYLIEEHGCDPMCQTRKGFVPLHLATLNDHFDIVEYLIEEQGCDPMFQSKVGKTALHYAAERQDIKLINYLLLRGADPNILSSSFLQFTQTNYPFLYCYRSDLPLAGTKVFVIGNQGAGKSSLVESLKQERRWLIGRFTNVQVSPETTGIISHLCSSNYFGDIMLYDFAGHSVYYASHSVLIQNSTNSSQVPVFVLVLDLLLSTADFSSQLEYWVSFLRCTCSASIVLVIAGSHYDVVNSLDFQTKMAVIVKFKDTIKKTELNIHFVPLDCRKAKSNGIDKIRGIISQLCKGTRGKSVLCTFHYMLLSVFKWSFGNEVAFQLSDAIEMLRHTNIPLPYVDEDYVFSLCEDLCAMSCILFLKSKTPSKCWIALDQSKVLHEIQRFKLDQKFVNAMKRVTTGIVPHSLLLTNFPTYNLDFVIRYMLEMEYFQLIDDGVLGKVSSDEPHYFFPDQVLSVSPSHLWISDTNYKNYFGWCLKSKDNFFFPRFVQVLLLRIATQHDLVDMQDPISDNSLPQLRPGTKIWKSGISWINQGCEIIIEVIEHNTGIIIMARCWDNYKVSHYRICSAVVRTVLKVKEDIYPPQESEEYIINPEQMNKYPLSHTSVLQVVSIRELVHSSLHHESDVVLYNMGAKHDPHFHIQLTMDNLIGFDPILVLSKASLTALFSGGDCEMSRDTLRIIADDLSDHWEPMCKVLGVYSKEFQRKLKDNPPDPTEKCLRSIHEAYRVSGCSSVTRKWLREKLEKYSILCGRNPLVSGPVYGIIIVISNSVGVLCTILRFGQS